MISRRRDLLPNLGSSGNNLYWAMSGWYVGSDAPDWSKLPTGKSWTYYWNEYYSKSDIANAWFDFGMGKAATKSAVGPSNGSYEQITYENGRPRFNECEHRTFKSTNLAFTAAYGKQASVGKPSYLPYYRYACTVNASPFTVIHLADPSAASARAWHEMQPRFEGGISMINFLLELSDIKQLLRHGTRILNKLQNLPEIAYKCLKRVRRKGADVAGPMAQLILEKNLGIDPLIGDLFQILCQLFADVQDAQRMFALKGELGSVRHYTENLIDDHQLSPPAYNDLIANGLVQRTDFTATLKFKYDYELRKGADLYTKYWGLTGSAEALWNAIPFSFVIDYFLKVGQAIHRMEKDPNVHMDAISYCESLKTRSTVGKHWKPGSYWTHSKLWVDGSSNASPVGTLISGYESLLYTRVPCAPNKGAALPRVNIPNAKQLTNMGALAISFMS